MKGRAFLLYAAWKRGERAKDLLALLPEKEQEERMALLEELGDQKSADAMNALDALFQESRRAYQRQLRERFGDMATRVDPRVAAILVSSR